VRLGSFVFHCVVVHSGGNFLFNKIIMAFFKKIRTRMSRNESFDEDSKVLIVTLLFCLFFVGVGFQKTLGTSLLVVLGLVQLLMVLAIGEIRGITLLRIPSEPG